VSDFHQTGLITALHRLGPRRLDWLEAELKRHAREQPVTLVLPCLHTEIAGRALPGIREVLRTSEYLHSIVVSVSGCAEPDDFRAVCRFFAELPRALCVWGSGPRVGELLASLASTGLAAGGDGKGRAVWLGAGYAMARGESSSLAFHDCDVLTYDRELLARLCLPVVHPNLGYEFCKGYYGRATDRLYGRVTRLFATPLLRALMRTLGRLPLLEFLESFRYPLSGEFAMKVDLARQVRVPSDWGVEIGLLAEVWRNVSPKRVCQTELCDSYEHRHREPAPGDPAQGLAPMVVDIASSLIRNLASVGVQFDAGFLNTVCATYLREAQDMVAAYADVALINGLRFEQHAEEALVETFAQGLRAAGLRFVQEPARTAMIPNWHRVISARPEFWAELRYAVESDSREFAPR
jgi:glucosyl-3-phosphoglycerate synthase